MSAYQDKRVARLSNRALKALAGLEGVRSNPLSPLVVLEFPAGRADGEEMAAQLESMDGPWEWAAPALVDPQRSIALLYADPEHARLGQYVFPDPDGAGPAFAAETTAEDLKLSGPWSLGEIRMALLEQFSLEAVADLPHARVDLTRRQLWGLAAFVDAYRVSRLTRELKRLGGLPEGVSIAEVVEAWSTGLGTPNPEWSVSMLSLLGPEKLPAGFAAEIPGVLAELAGAGLLEKVNLDGKNDHYAPRGVVERLCLELVRSQANFGLVFRRLVEPAKVEATILYGWRTAEGIWLADLRIAEGSQPAILQVGPYLFTDVLTDLLGAPPEKTSTAAFHMETPYSRDALISRLRALPAGGEPAQGGAVPALPGQGVKPPPLPAQGVKPPALPAQGVKPPALPAQGVKPPALPTRLCARCGSPLIEGQAFCPNCGARV
jgi:hypothetical protein